MSIWQHLKHINLSLGERGSALTEMVIIAPICCFLLVAALYLANVVEQKIYLEIAGRNLSGSEQPSPAAGHADEAAYQSAVLPTSGLTYSSSAKLNKDFAQDLAAQKDGARFVAHTALENRSAETWREVRERLLNPTLPQNITASYSWAAKAQSELAQLYTKLILNQTSLLLIDERASTLSSQIDYYLPVTALPFGNELVRLGALLNLAPPPAAEAPSSAQGAAAEEGPDDTSFSLTNPLRFSTLHLHETASGFHPESYRDGGLIGYALYSVLPRQGPAWLMRARDFSYDRQRLQQGFSRACPYEFRASSECAYDSLLSSSLYAQIAVFTAESAGAADIISAFFSGDATTAAKRAAWEVVERSAKDMGKQLLDKIETTVKEKIKGKIDAIKGEALAKVKEKLGELKDRVGLEQLSGDKLLEWLGLGGGGAEGAGNAAAPAAAAGGGPGHG